MKSELSEQTKFYNQNVKALCERLNKDKRKGTEKLAFVIMEIISAQNSGLIPKNKNHNQSKFAAIMLENVVFKLSKQDKDRQLIKVIKESRKEILAKLMRESVISNEEVIEDRLDQVFDKMSEVQQKGFDQFFTKIDENMKFLKEELTSVKTNVADLQE